MHGGDNDMLDMLVSIIWAYMAGKFKAELSDEER